MKQPKILYIRVSENCNSHCFMCHYAGKCDSYNITTQQYDNILDYAKKNNIKMVRFTGGEPLLHKEILKFIQKAHAYGFKTSIITNGYLLKVMAVKLIEAGLDQFIISLDGSKKEIHDSLRNFDGCFDNIISSIKIIKNINSKINIRINTVVSGKNIFDIINIYKLLLNLGVNQWSIIPVKFKDNLWIEESNKYYEDFLREVKDNDDNKLIFLGDSKCFAGKNNEEIQNTFNNVKVNRSKQCNVVDYVRFFIPDKDIIVPCNCIAHRLSQIPVSDDCDKETYCENVRKWIKENCDKCSGCEPLNIYINDNPWIMEEEQIMY